MTDNEQDAREKQTYASFGGRKPQLLGDEQAALIASQARRIEELEARIADIATRMDRQVKASDGYAEEYARADDPRPTTWQIGNSHFTDLARDLRALLNRGEG